MIRHFIYGFIAFSLLGCCKEKILDKPIGNAYAIPIYNQAYQENFEEDKVGAILQTATNAYVLLDPYTDESINSNVPLLKANGNEVGAYISIGTGEDWRADYEQLKPFLVEKEWGSWPGEYFVKETTTGVVDVIKARIDQIALWGYDWVEFDNMDWAFDDKNRKKYDISTTLEQAIAYYNELCDYAIMYIPKA